MGGCIRQTDIHAGQPARSYRSALVVGCRQTLDRRGAALRVVCASQCRRTGISGRRCRSHRRIPVGGSGGNAAVALKETPTSATAGHTDKQVRPAGDAGSGPLNRGRPPLLENNPTSDADELATSGRTADEGQLTSGRGRQRRPDPATVISRGREADQPRAGRPPSTGELGPPVGVSTPLAGRRFSTLGGWVA
jgi:hypothetical protein